MRGIGIAVVPTTVPVVPTSMPPVVGPCIGRSASQKAEHEGCAEPERNASGATDPASMPDGVPHGPPFARSSLDVEGQPLPWPGRFSNFPKTASAFFFCSSDIVLYRASNAGTSFFSPSAWASASFS